MRAVAPAFEERPSPREASRCPPPEPAHGSLCNQRANLARADAPCSRRRRKRRATQTIESPDNPERFTSGANECQSGACRRSSTSRVPVRSRGRYLPDAVRLSRLSLAPSSARMRRKGRKSPPARRLPIARIHRRSHPRERQDPSVGLVQRRQGARPLPDPACAAATRRLQSRRR